MKRKIYLRILIGIITFVLLIMFFIKVVVEPRIREEILTSINNTSGEYLLQIEKVHVLILQSGIKLENITLISKEENNGQPNLKGEIETVTCKGIRVIKALYRNEIDIREAVIYNSRITGSVVFPKTDSLPKVSPVDIRVASLLFDKVFLDVKSATTAEAYSVKDGSIKLHEINLEKHDTLSLDILGPLDFEAKELKTVTADSMYSISVAGLNYSATSNTLQAISLDVQPNYTENEFSSLNEFQKARIEAKLGGITLYNFSVADYIHSRDLVSSYIEIREMGMQVFKDKSKPFRHVDRPTFQDMMYNYPGALSIDSIGILNGNIVYSEEAEKGIVSFNEINAHLYQITNDTIYKTEKAYLELNAHALFMGKSELNVLLKARIFDNQNTFSVNGSLSGIEVSELNPILEKNASITFTSGKINNLYFSFSANNTKASGNLKILYQDLNVALMNKQTGDITAIKEQVKSLIANMVVYESNPMPGQELRPGIIDYHRDPERFVFGYFFRALLTGIESSIYKSANRKKNS